MTPTKGLVLGDRYTLVRRIAIGGMGEVWVANDGALHREVAIKVLRAEYAGNDDFLARLRTEARNSAALSHPNIAQMYDYGEQQGSGFLVMELVVGEPMADLLEREPVIKLPRLLPILAQTARGLHAAHVAGVVHRDIKPGNILLDRSGEVKITDFGVSLAANQVPMTATGMVMGTAQYLSPEQAIGQAATGASDLYALGIVAYESVVGHRPFTGATPVDIAVAHVNEKVPPLPSTVDPELATVIMKMLAKDPKRRPRTGAALAQVLDEIAARIARDPWGVPARPAGAVKPRRGDADRSNLKHSDPKHSDPKHSDPQHGVAARPSHAASDPNPPAAGAATAEPGPVPPPPAAPWQRPPAAPSRSRQGSDDAAGPRPRSFPPRSSARDDEGTPASDAGHHADAPGRRSSGAGAGATRGSHRDAPSKGVTERQSAGARQDASNGAARPTRSGSRTASGTRATRHPGAISDSTPAVRSPHGMLRPGDGTDGAPPRPSGTPPVQTRAAQRAAQERTRTSTTTGQRVGGSPRGISWPLVALLGLLVIVLVITLTSCAPPATTSEMPHIVTRSLPLDDGIHPVDGMMLPIAGRTDAAAELTTPKDV